MAKSVLRPVLAAIAVVASTQAGHAAQKILKPPAVTVAPGKASGIHDLYAWDDRCRPVSIKFKVLQVSGGRLYPVPETYRIRSKASDACNGRQVKGRKIMFKPNPGFVGSTSVRYSIATPGTDIKDTYVFARSIKVR